MNGATLSELPRLVCVVPATKHRRSWPTPIGEGQMLAPPGPRQSAGPQLLHQWNDCASVFGACPNAGATRQVSCFPRGKDEGPTSLVRAISSPVATALSTRVPISVGALIPVFPLWGPSPLYHSVPRIHATSTFNRVRPIPRSSTCPRPSDGTHQIVRNYDKLFWWANKQQRKIDSCFLSAFNGLRVG